MGEHATEARDAGVRFPVVPFRNIYKTHFVYTEIKMADNINVATAAYVFGVLSIVLAFFSPFVGLVMGIVGLVHASKNNVPKAKRLNIIGIILSIVLLLAFGFLLALVGFESGSFPAF